MEKKDTRAVNDAIIERITGGKFGSVLRRLDFDQLEKLKAQIDKMKEKKKQDKIAKLEAELKNVRGY